MTFGLLQYKLYENEEQKYQDYFFFLISISSVFLSEQTLMCMVINLYFETVILLITPFVTECISNLITLFFGYSYHLFVS